MADAVRSYQAECFLRLPARIGKKYHSMERLRGWKGERVKGLIAVRPPSRNIWVRLASSLAA